jgi:hypothetical protein
MIRILIAALLAVAASPAAAQEGRWAVHAGGRTLILLELERAPGGGWSGRMIRPDHFSVSGGGARALVFSQVSGPTVTRPITAAAETPRGLELTVEDRAGRDPDRFLFRPGSAGTAQLSFIGFEEITLPLAPAVGGETVPASWPAGRSYAALIDWPTNE